MSAEKALGIRPPGSQPLLSRVSNERGSPMPSGIHGSSSSNSLIFSVHSRNISFTYCYIANLAFPWDPLMWCLFFLPIPGHIGPTHKIRCGTGVFLASAPSHSPFLLPEILWHWTSYRLTVPPTTSSSGGHPPDFNSWLTVTVFLVTAKSRWMILSIL